MIARGLAGLERYTIWEQTPEGPLCRLEASQSPLWDTAFSVIALSDAGLSAADPALQRAAEWLLAEEIPGPGDWQIRKPGLAPGGWAFEFDNDYYPCKPPLAACAIGFAIGRDHGLIDPR